MNTMLPPVPCAIIFFATACEHRKDPVVLMSRVLRHSAAVISIAWVHWMSEESVISQCRKLRKGNGGNLFESGKAWRNGACRMNYESERG